MDGMNDSVRELYGNMQSACSGLLAATKQALSEAADASRTGGDILSCLDRLEKTGALMRADATRFLTEEAVSSFDESIVYDAKRHVHTEIGRVLTETRLFVSGQGDAHTQDGKTERDCAEILAAWEAVLSSLQSGAWKKETVDARKQILDAAQAAGVQVRFVKELPEEEAEIRAYIREASVKIVAAVRAGEEAVTL